MSGINSTVHFWTTARATVCAAQHRADLIREARQGPCSQDRAPRHKKDRASSPSCKRVAKLASARPISPASHVVFWSTVKMHRDHVRCCTNGCKHRSGQAERYDGCKDGSPDAHDSSKATRGPAT